MTRRGGYRAPVLRHTCSDRFGAACRSAAGVPVTRRSYGSTRRLDRSANSRGSGHFRSARVLGCIALAGLFLAAGCRELDIDPILAPQDGLVLHYSFDAGSGKRLVDEAGTNGNATLFGGAAFTPNGVRGGAITFDGEEGSYVEDPDAGLALNGLRAVTVAAWVKSHVVGTDAGILIGEPPVGRDRALTLRYDASGARSGGTNLIKGGVTVLYTARGNSFESVSNLQTDAWQHLVMTWESGRGFQLYIDREPVQLVENTITSGPLEGMSTLLVGRGSKDTESSWNGLIDELFIYDRVLRPDEIRILYDRGTRF